MGNDARSQVTVIIGAVLRLCSKLRLVADVLDLDHLLVGVPSKHYARRDNDRSADCHRNGVAACLWLLAKRDAEEAHHNGQWRYAEECHEGKPGWHIEKIVIKPAYARGI
jgi:hypothetical protein